METDVVETDAFEESCSQGLLYIYRTGNLGFVQNVLEADFVRRFTSVLTSFEAMLIVVLVFKHLFPNFSLFNEPLKPTNARKTTRLLY